MRQQAQQQRDPLVSIMKPDTWSTRLFAIMCLIHRTLSIVFDTWFAFAFWMARLLLTSENP